MQNKGRTKNAGNKRYDRDRVDTVAAAALVKNPEKDLTHAGTIISLLSLAYLACMASMQIKRDPSSMHAAASLRRRASASVSHAARYVYGAARVCFFPVRAPTFTCPSPAQLCAAGRSIRWPAAVEAPPLEIRSHPNLTLAKLSGAHAFTKAWRVKLGGVSCIALG